MELENLKKIRKSKKIQVSKRVNELRRLVVDDSYSDVVYKFSLIKGVFNEFIAAHDEYHDKLQEESEIAISDAYYDEVECNYINELQGVRDYIQRGSAAGQTSASTIQNSSVSYVKLPPVPQPDVFNGRPETYPLWKAAFNTLVGKHNIGYDEKMFYLKQYTEGEARSAIEALFLCPDQSSYTAALDILENRFGNPSLVASAFRKRLEGWPKIGDRDSKGLQKFSDFLAQICVAKKSYSSLEILSDEFENRKLLNKLPAWLVNEWIRMVVEAGNLPNFDKFSDFIKDKATIANHTLWSGYSSSQHYVNTKKPSIIKPSQVHVAQATPPMQSTQTPRPICPVCGEGHDVTNCTDFTNMGLVDRKSAIKDKGMCFGCLSVGHHSKGCRNRQVCAVCARRHPTLLHDYSLPSQTTTTSNVNLATNTTSNMKTKNRVTTMVLPVMLRHKNSDTEVLVYALLDTQSNTNFVTEDVARRLNVCGRKAKLDLTTMNGRMNIPTTAVDGLEMRSVFDNTRIGISSCYVRDSIPCRRDIIPTADVVGQWPHLSHIDIPKYYENAPIGLLIGYHCPQVIQPLEIATGGDGEPFGWRTRLGWCVIGATCSEVDMDDTDKLGATHIVQGCIAFKTGCREIILEDERTLMPGMEEGYSAEDVKFMEIMAEKMYQRNDGHYEAPLPLKQELPFPFNKSVSQNRLRSLESKFKRDPVYHARYAQVMQDMIDNGFSEAVPPNDLSPARRTWYIPHHGVQQSTKLRVVFDCSSEFQGVCLNDVLLQGPNLLNLLLGILFRFRLEPIGITCDIKEMYYQFMVSPGDRDLLRYLWWKDGDYNSEPIDYRMRVHLFGATSSPGVATYALRKIAEDHGSKHAPEASRFIRRDFYVDDGVTSVSTVDSACDLIYATMSLLSEGGCKCHKILSNSKEVMDSVCVEDRAPKQESGLNKTLGIWWNVETDNFHFPLDWDVGKATRRGLLSTIAKIYDPLGVISPLVHQAKLLLHQLCYERYDWDDMLPDTIMKQYERWCMKLTEIGEVIIPRCVRSSKIMTALELHHFADASSCGYAASSYLRFMDEDGKVHVVFMIGKCRVCPLKPVLSIPRLELTAAVLSVQLATKLRSELPLQYTEYFWTDSTIVLGYIKNTSARFKVFVANRVQRIHDGSDPDRWFHVNSTENPADDGSRAVLSARWLQGPDFLWRSELSTHHVHPTVSFDDAEVQCLRSQGEETTEIVHIHTFHNWFTTLKIWAWVLRFVDNCRKVKREGSLKVRELEEAKFAIILMMQRSSFAEEFVKLASQKTVPRHSSLYKLDVFLDEKGTIRVGGRIRNSGFSDELKHPFVLPSNHHITTLIIEHFHQKVHHQGRGITSNEIRSNGYWILSLQGSVKKTIRSCVICSRLRGKPVEQKMADLPKDRLSPCLPFWYTGCDLFGPFVVKSGRKESKRYGVMFTCLVSRAVHLEVAHSLTTDSFINAFRRFVCLRGAVREVRCDQGTNLVGAKNELLKMGCDVIFNPPASSHRGGVWERMIGVARRIIEGILHEHGSRIDDEGLMTVLSETASVINSRPLNVDSLNDPQSLEPLTPNHLITMKSKVIPRMMTANFDQTDLYATKQWRRIQYMTDLFWSRWKKEIVQQHLSRAKWNTQRPNLKIGDVVLIIDDQCHRSYWKLARIIDEYKSQDGLVRSVKIRLADHSILHRPVQKLIKIVS